MNKKLAFLIVFELSNSKSKIKKKKNVKYNYTVRLKNRLIRQQEIPGNILLRGLLLIRLMCREKFVVYAIHVRLLIFSFNIFYFWFLSSNKSSLSKPIFLKKATQNRKGAFYFLSVLSKIRNAGREAFIIFY